MKLKKKKKLVIISILLALIGIIIWNTPGVKSRRLGEQCNKKYNIAIQTSESDKTKSIFENARNACYTNIARKYQNTQLCDKIKDESFRVVCEAQTYFWNKSVEFCEKDDQKNICLDVISIKNNDPNICSKIDLASLRKNCENRQLK